MAGNLWYDTPPAVQPRRDEYPQHQYVQPPPAQPPYPQAPYPQPTQPQAPYPRAEQQGPQPPLGLDPEIWPVIRQSAARLARNERAFIQQLHYDMTKPNSDPTGAPAGDIWVFCERMARSLLWIVLADQPLGVIADELRKVGAQNWADGFPDSLYENVAYALVQTVHYLTVYDWSSSIGSAWISYFMWVKPHLLAGAQQAAEREAARVNALSRYPQGGHTQVVGDVNPEPAASLLDDDDDDNVGYGQIMVSMTRSFRREPPRRPP